MGLQQLAIGGDIQGYALSDQDFANRYPGLQDAYNQWQANLGQQVGQVAQGAGGQAQILGGLGSQILGRQGTQTTGDINAVRNAAATAAGAAQPIMNLAATQAGLAQPIYNLGQQQAGLAPGLVGMGQQQAGLAPSLVGLGQQQAGLAGGLLGMGRQQAGIGAGINRMGGQLAGAAQIPYQLGQQLLQEPIDPLTQQQMMRAGLTSAAGSMGAASLGQGMAGQAAAARQLGLSTLQYGQAMRGEAMGDINQYASMLGAAGQMRGLGAQTIGAGGQTVGLGGQQLTQGGGLIGLGGQQIAQGAGTVGLGGQQLTAGGGLMGAAGAQLAGAGGLYGQGAQTAATAGGLSGAAQGLQEAYGMNTAQMANIYGQLQNQQNAQLLGGIATAGQMFQKRPFGLGGSNLAQSELGQTGAYNSFQQANYATMNGIAFNQAQMQAQQQQLGAQQSAGMMSAGVGAVGAAASAASAAAMSCWVARECLSVNDPRWKQFRLWLLNCAPVWLRRLYLRHGEAFAAFLSTRPVLRYSVRMLLLGILRVHKKRISLLWGLSQAGIFSSVGCAAARVQWPSDNYPVRNPRHYRSAQLSMRSWGVHPCPA